LGIDATLKAGTISCSCCNNTFIAIAVIFVFKINKGTCHIKTQIKLFLIKGLKN